MRFLKLSFALLVLSCFFTWIPFGFKIFLDHLHQLVSIFNNTLFVFLLNNLIIFNIALSFKNFSGSNANPDLYHEFVTNSEHIQRIPTAGDDSCVIVAKELQDNQIVCYSGMKETVVPEKTYCRRPNKGCSRVLRRSETDIFRAMVVAKGRPEKKAVEEMSNEEFRLKVDAFIEEHKWYQKQERSAEAMAITVG